MYVPRQSSVPHKVQYRPRLQVPFHRAKTHEPLHAGIQNWGKPEVPRSLSTPWLRSPAEIRSSDPKEGSPNELKDKAALFQQPNSRKQYWMGDRPDPDFVMDNLGWMTEGIQDNPG